MKNNNYGMIFLGIMSLGLLFCVVNNNVVNSNKQEREDQAERDRDREREQERRERRRESHFRVEYRPEVRTVEYVQPAPRVSTQFNWSFGNGRSGFNMSYNVAAPVCRPCYVVRENRYYVHPMSTYTYYF